MRDKIKLVSSAGTGHYYTTTKNKRTMPDKLELKKYDPVVRKHVIYREAKIKYPPRPSWPSCPPPPPPPPTGGGTTPPLTPRHQGPAGPWRDDPVPGAGGLDRRRHRTKKVGMTFRQPAGAWQGCPARGSVAQATDPS